MYPESMFRAKIRKMPLLSSENNHFNRLKNCTKLREFVNVMSLSYISLVMRKSVFGFLIIG